MSRKSIEQIAREANGRSRACKKCPHLKYYTPDLCNVCYKSFIEGFIKGYKYKKQLKQNNHERKY